MGLIFYPRGGSAQVVRYLSRALQDLGQDVLILTGSLRHGNPQHDARIFYEGLPLAIADYTDAWDGFQRQANPISEHYAVPFHPSYEDKPDVPDRVFYSVTRQEYERLLRCWKNLFRELHGDFDPDIVHLHHLNHMHIAARTEFPSTPTATQLHGTELKMLECMDRLRTTSRTQRQRHAFWRGIMDRAIHGMDHCFAISPDVRERGRFRFSLDDGEISTIPNGVDISLFRPLAWGDEQKSAFLRSILVEEPQGWDESGIIGSIRYTDEDLARLHMRDGSLKPLAIYVGRFLDFKRVPLLIKAVAKVNQLFPRDAEWPPYNLLIWGGMPDEYEGVHPFTLVQELELSNVFFAGWLPHALLSKGLNLADVFVAPSYFEPFGQVFLEAMATAVPVVATRSGGPLSFVVDSGPQANGWFCDVDDVNALARTLYEALSRPSEQKRRGQNALALIRGTYCWKRIAGLYLEEYRQLIQS